MATTILLLGKNNNVYTKYPIRKIIQTGQESGRLAKWISFLSTFNTIFKPRRLEKGHVVASLLSDFHIEDLPSLEYEINILSMNLTVMLESAASTSEIPLPHVEDSTNDTRDQHSTSSMSEIP